MNQQAHYLRLPVAMQPVAQTPNHQVKQLVAQFTAIQSGKFELDKASVHALLDHTRKLVLEFESQYSRDEILRLLRPLRKIARQSPFMRRAQDWPKGYPGDFETIEHILSRENKAPLKSLGYFLEDFFIQSPICEQHINKVQHQSRLILNALSLHPAPNILSIGCGTSEDVRLAMDKVKCSEAHITLVDIDDGALAVSVKQLAPIRSQLTIKHGNIYRIMRRLTDQYHLILIGGVFDYLDDKTIVAILQSLRHNLGDKGKICFTNIDKGNPYRVFMEYLSNWHLKERSRADIVRLLEDAGWPAGMVEFKKDDTGLTHIVELSKQ